MMSHVTSDQEVTLPISPVSWCVFRVQIPGGVLQNPSRAAAITMSPGHRTGPELILFPPEMHPVLILGPHH